MSTKNTCLCSSRRQIFQLKRFITYFRILFTIIYSVVLKYPADLFEIICLNVVALELTIRSAKSIMLLRVVQHLVEKFF